MRRISSFIYSIDQYGVRNYHTTFLAILSFAILYFIIALLAALLVHVEGQVDSSNIKNYADAFWTLQMAASTIGFGDFYPTTSEGRFIVASIFYIGVGIVGFIGAQLVNHILGFSDTNVKNRELRHQNAQIIEHNKRLEEKIDRLLVTLENSRDTRSK